MSLRRYRMSLEFTLEVDDLDPETVQKRFGDVEIEPEMWEAIAEERKILLALVEDQETILRYSQNSALDLLSWEDGSGRWRSGVGQADDRLRAKEGYDELLLAGVKHAPPDVRQLLERLLAEGVEWGVGFPAETELEESFRLTLEKAEFVEEAPPK